MTSEGSLPYIASDESQRRGWPTFLSATMDAFTAVKPMEFLWSPSNGDHTPNATDRVAEEAALNEVVCGLSHPLAIHFQV